MSMDTWEAYGQFFLGQFYDVAKVVIIHNKI
jgi:hypothetical protein